MIRFFLLFVALLGFGGLGLWFAEILKEDGPGYVLIYFNHYSVETSFWLYVLAQMAFGVLVCGLVWLLFNSVKLLVKVGLLPKRFSTRKAKKHQANGLLAYADQDYSQASKALNRAGKRSGQAFVDYLLSARAALQVNDIDQAQAAFEKARNCADKDDLSIALFGVDMALALKDDSKALDRLQQASERFSHDRRFIVQAASVYHRLAQWDVLQPLLKPLKKQKLVHQGQFETYAKDTYAGLLAAAVKHKDLAGLNKVFKQADSYQLDQAVYMAFFHGLIALGDQQEARVRIERQLKQRWNETLLDLYLQLPVTHVTDQQRYINSLAEAHGDNPKMLEAQATVAMRQKQWSEAKGLLEKSLAVDESASAWLKLAQVCEKLHQSADQVDAMNKAAALL